MDKDESIRRNRGLADCWGRFRPHRERVTQELTGLARDDRPLESRRLAILGAGNVNDVDLKVLLDSFERITLLDWDAEAMAAGVERQRNRLTIDQHEPFQRVNIASPMDLNSDDLRNDSPTIDSLGEFDVVASIGLLSQLVETELAGLQKRRISDPTSLSRALTAVRDSHLEIIRRLVKTDGSSFLTTEILSTDTAPELQDISDSELPAFIHRAVVQGNFFSGMQPAAVLHSVRQTFPEQEWRIVTPAPWTWDLGPRVYAVVAFVMGRF